MAKQLHELHQDERSRLRPLPSARNEVAVMVAEPQITSETKSSRMDLTRKRPVSEPGSHEVWDSHIQCVGNEESASSYCGFAPLFRHESLTLAIVNLHQAFTMTSRSPSLSRSERTLDPHATDNVAQIAQLLARDKPLGNAEIQPHAHHPPVCVPKSA